MWGIKTTSLVDRSQRNCVCVCVCVSILSVYIMRLVVLIPYTVEIPCLTLENNFNYDLGKKTIVKSDIRFPFLPCYICHLDAHLPECSDLETKEKTSISGQKLTTVSSGHLSGGCSLILKFMVAADIVSGLDQYLGWTEYWAAELVLLFQPQSLQQIRKSSQII